MLMPPGTPGRQPSGDGRAVSQETGGFEYQFRSALNFLGHAKCTHIASYLAPPWFLGQLSHSWFIPARGRGWVFMQKIQP